MRINLRNPIGTEREPAALQARTDRRGRTTTIVHPDAQYPADHSVNTVDPHLHADDFRGSVRERVAGLAAAGALDQDNLEALSSEIAAWLQTWIALAHRTDGARREVAELLLAQALQNQTEVARELATLRDRHAEIVAVRQVLLSQLGFADDLTPSTDLRADPDRPASRVRDLRHERS